jgi:hypothetical protein
VPKLWQTNGRCFLRADCTAKATVQATRCTGATTAAAAAAANGGGVRAAADEARHARRYEQVPWRSLQHGGNDGEPKTTQQP